MSTGRANRDSAPVSSAIMSRYQTLRRLLIKISYTSPFPPELFLSSAPPALTLPILSHLFLSYAPQLTAHFLASGFLLSSSSFSLASLYGLLHALFGYHPQLSQQQFSSERGYVERKLQLLCDVLQLCVAKAEELERDKGTGSSGSGSKGGLPRVAVIVKEQRRSAGEDQPERKEQRPQQARVVRTQRAEKREEQKVQGRDDEEELESGSPERLHHQHVSFTHDDSSQPLSPSHLSPHSTSHRSPQRLSPPPHSHSQPRSAPHSTATTDPLLALHQQLHRISHRTNQLAHTPQPDNSSQSAAVEQLVERVQALESSVRDELSELREEVRAMRDKLAAVEQRERDREQQQPQQQTTTTQAYAEAEGTEEAAADSGGVERVTSGGGGGKSGNATGLPSDMSEFLTHMNDRLSSTAKLLESSRRARGRPSEGE